MKLKAMPLVAFLIVVAAFLFLGAHAASAQVNYRITPITVWGPESVGQCFPMIWVGPPINNQGEVAFTAECGRLAGVVVQGDGRISRIVHSVPLPICDGCIQGVAGDQLSINDAGVVAFKALAFRDGRLRDRIMTASPAGVATILSAETAGLDSLHWPQISNSGTISFGAGLDLNGSRYGVFRIADGALRVVADDTTPTPRGFTQPGPMSAINSSDQIAFWASATGPGNGAVFRADTNGTMATMWPTLVSSSFLNLNDRGVFGFIDGLGRAATSDGISTRVIADRTQDDFFTAFRTVSLNNDGAIALHADVHDPLSFVATGIFTGPDRVRDKVLQVGDTLDGNRVIDIRMSHDSINDLGQIAFTAVTHRASDYQNIFGVYRADPPGSTSENPLMPINPPTGPPAPGTPPPVWRFPIMVTDLRAQRATWIDPDVAVGYRYAMSGAGASNFQGVIVPEPLPNGDDTFEVVFGHQSAVLTAGVLFDLAAATGGAGVREFTIRGIDTTEALDPHNPFAFVTGLTFVSAFSGEVTMTPLLEDEDADRDPPVLRLPAELTVEATSGAGAVATFDASAEDVTDGRVAIGCSPASGGVFPLGRTEVACTAVDAAGNHAHGTFAVIVADTTAPSLTLPAELAVDATSPAGAVASLGWTAVDAVDANPVVTCSPASGDLFGIGRSAVACSARDAAGNQTVGTFTVVVRDANAQLAALEAELASYGLRSGLANSLGAKLRNARRQLASERCSAANILSAFLHEVAAQAGKGLTDSQAGRLSAAALRIRSVTGC